VSSEKSVWVIAEHSEGQVEEISFEVLSCARKLADDLDGQVYAVAVGSSSQELAETLGSYGADKVFLLHSPLLLEYRIELYVEALTKLLANENPEVVLCGATLIGRDLSPRLAARLGTGLISDCVNLDLNREGLLLGSKLTYGGRINSTIFCPASRPQMATVKPGVTTVAKPDNAKKPEVALITPELSQLEPRTSLKRVVRADPEKISLDEADIIVTGGRGMGEQRNFQLLEEMAKQLGGVVAGSLGAVDEGWVPRRKLVGQTGTTVAPKLYIACGISGSVYHVLGMKDSEFVIAINKDRDAPIFKVADMSIIGDVIEVTSAIIACLRGVTGNTARRNSEVSDTGEV
jgi:electron transfer flavoprotein alpha subunit